MVNVPFKKLCISIYDAIKSEELISVGILLKICSPDMEKYIIDATDGSCVIYDDAYADFSVSMIANFRQSALEIRKKDKEMFDQDVFEYSDIVSALVLESVSVATYPIVKDVTTGTNPIIELGDLTVVVYSQRDAAIARGVQSRISAAIAAELKKMCLRTTTKITA